MVASNAATGLRRTLVNSASTAGVLRPRNRSAISDGAVVTRALPFGIRRCRNRRVPCRLHRREKIPVTSCFRDREPVSGQHFTSGADRIDVIGLRAHVSFRAFRTFDLNNSLVMISKPANKLTAPTAAPFHRPQHTRFTHACCLDDRRTGPARPCAGNARQSIRPAQGHHAWSWCNPHRPGLQSAQPTRASATDSCPPFSHFRQHLARRCDVREEVDPRDRLERVHRCREVAGDGVGVTGI